MDRPSRAVPTLLLASLLACGDADGRASDSAGSISAGPAPTTLTAVTVDPPGSDASSAETGGATDPTSAGPTTDPTVDPTADPTGSPTSATMSDPTSEPLPCPNGCPAGQVCDPEFSFCVPAPCAVNEDCPDGQLCDAGVCGAVCDATEFVITKLPPNLMIVLDRSGSMAKGIDGDTRWNVAKAAVKVLVDEFNDEIRFGLDTYSSCTGGGCSAGTVVVPIADKNAGAVNGFLADKLDEGSGNGQGNGNGGIKYLCDSGDPETSTGPTLQALVGQPSLQDPTRGNAILLITDGAENCTPPDSKTAAANLLAQPIGVKTYVVGFSQDVDGDALNEVAAAGGTGGYYQADSLDQLKQAFADIANAVATCDYALMVAPDDLADMYVFFNDLLQIPMDAANGWTYDPVTMTLSFHGMACQQIQGGQVTDIDVVFGCAAPAPG